VTSTLTVPKSFKGKVVGDLDLTGLRTTGDMLDAANDLSFLLTAPSGLTVTISNASQNGFGDQSIGPLTFNDDTPTSLCDIVTPPCEDPQQTLVRPFGGTANHFAVGSSDTGPLSAFDGTPMRGAWTLTVYDTDAAQTSVLNTWGLSITPAQPATKSKKKKGGVFTGSASPNAPVLDDAAAGASTPVVSTINVGKKFKNGVIGDVNVTGITTTGANNDAPDDLEVKLTAPNGTTVRLIGSNNIADNFQNLGPLTLDDDTATATCAVAAPPCPNPLQSLNAPHAGTANLVELGGGGSGPLSAFDGGPMRGTWTLTVWDEADAGQSSTFNSWGLKVTAAKPVTAPGKPKKAGASAKKKKKKGKSSFSQTKNPNVAISDDAAAGASAEVVSTITVGKQFKGKTVGDVNVTGIRTTGVGVAAAGDLTFTLVGPTGRAIQLTDGGFTSQSVNGLTLDDETKVSICPDATPPCEDPVHTLNPPFAGTANMRELFTEGTGPLSGFDGTRMKGDWTLHVVDTGGAGQSSILNSWGLRITAAKPVK
jgi:subtilisin-like proprotein convertase family protein